VVVVATEARIWSGLGDGYWLRKGMIIASTFSTIRTSRGSMRKREIVFSLFSESNCGLIEYASKHAEHGLCGPSCCYSVPSRGTSHPSPSA
jgi:hypothetical protein